MELLKSKGMIVFLVMVISLTVISSINTKKYDDKTKSVENEYVYINTK